MCYSLWYNAPTMLPACHLYRESVCDPPVVDPVSKSHRLSCPGLGYEQHRIRTVPTYRYRKFCLPAVQFPFLTAFYLHHPTSIAKGTACLQSVPFPPPNTLSDITWCVCVCVCVCVRACAVASRDCLVAHSNVSLIMLNLIS